MATARHDNRSQLAETVETLVESDGTAGAPHAAAMMRPDAPMRDLADAVHALAVIHGAFPGIVDHAQGGALERPVAGWLAVAAYEVARERKLLAQLTATVGPRPSTPGQSAAEAAVAAQRHALTMLARSDRNGCALGTAIAFVLDWGAVRRVLENGAARCGLEVEHRFDGFSAASHALLAELSPTPSVERAITFGAQQMLAQHRGLWGLLEARAAARRGS